MEVKDEKTNLVIPATPPGSPPPAPAAPPANPSPGDQVLTPEEAAKVVKRLAEAEKAVAEANDRAKALDGGLKKAVAGYKALIIQANPDVLPDLITGDSVEALDASLIKAKEVVGKVKATLEAQTAAARVPAGAPPRTPVDVSNLSAREKINLGVQKAAKK